MFGFEPCECIIHQPNVENDGALPFSVARWEKFQTCARKWMVLDGHERKLAIEASETVFFKLPWDEVPESLGYHDYCYRRFTDIKRIRGAEKRCKQKAHLYDNENNKEEGQQLGEEGVPDDNIDDEPSPKKCKAMRGYGGYVA